MQPNRKFWLLADSPSQKLPFTRGLLNTDKIPSSTMSVFSYQIKTHRPQNDGWEYNNYKSITSVLLCWLYVVLYIFNLDFHICLLAVFLAFSGTQWNHSDQWNSMKPAAGICLVSGVLMCNILYKHWALARKSLYSVNSGWKLRMKILFLCFLSVSLSRSHEHDIWGMFGGNFFKVSTNIHLNSAINWLDFYGQRSRPLWPHKTRLGPSIIHMLINCHWTGWQRQ